MTAWYMTLDILILTTSSKPENPFILISGHENTTDASNSDPPLLMGNYTNVHYQSLLPGQIVNLHEKKHESHLLKQSISKTNTKEPENSLEENRDDFIFRQGKLEIAFKSLGMSKWQCPFCQQVITKLGQHINNKSCPIAEFKLDKTEFASQLGSFREGYRLDMSRKRKQRSRANQLIQKGPEVIKAEINQQKQKKQTETKGRKRS